MSKNNKLYHKFKNVQSKKKLSKNLDEIEVLNRTESERNRLKKSENKTDTFVPAELNTEKQKKTDKSSSKIMLKIKRSLKRLKSKD